MGATWHRDHPRIWLNTINTTLFMILFPSIKLKEKQNFKSCKLKLMEKKFQNDLLKKMVRTPWVVPSLY